MTVTALRWPETTRHGIDTAYGSREGSGIWRPPVLDREPAGQPFRTCWYCGSVHLGDLYESMRQHPVRLEVADWKYGWPHKAYVRGVPNPLAGRTVHIGDDWKDGVERPIMGPAPAEAFAKVYFEHLTEVDDPHAFQLITDGIAVRTGICFTLADGRLHWKVGGL